MKFEVPEPVPKEDEIKEKNEDKDENQQQQQCKMIVNLKYLFGTLVKSSKKYSDASQVL